MDRKLIGVQEIDELVADYINWNRDMKTLESSIKQNQRKGNYNYDIQDYYQRINESMKETDEMIEIMIMLDGIEIDNNKEKNNRHNIFITDEDVRLVMMQTNASKENARKALLKNKGSIVNAIIELSSDDEIPYKDIELVMRETGTSYERAKYMIKKNKGDVFDAIMELTT